jgi:hypothetical protein
VVEFLTAVYCQRSQMLMRVGENASRGLGSGGFWLDHTKYGADAAQCSKSGHEGPRTMRYNAPW